MEHNQAYDLYHYGVLGMKWGVRRDQRVLDRISGRVKKIRDNEKEYRDKLSVTIDKNKLSDNARSKSDMKKLTYRNKSLVGRTAETATRVVTMKLLGDILTNKTERYTYLNADQIKKDLIEVATKTAKEVVLKDALAKSVSKNYDDKGNLKEGVNKNTSVTKQDVIYTSVRNAQRAVPIAKWMVGKKLSDIAKERRTNEAKFKAWGQNILPEKVDNIIWQSDDFMTAVIDNRGR